jgi:hypothetical protein
MRGSLNVQLTDGGPPVAPESPGSVAGPPFGAAPGSRLLAPWFRNQNHAASIGYKSNIQAKLNGEPRFPPGHP